MKKKVLNDFLYSIVASAMPILILQFIILPLTATKINSMEYGLLIALISWVNMSAITMGNVLNNIRLIENNKYTNKNLQGDFNIVLSVMLILNVILVTVGIIYLGELNDIFGKILLVLTSTFLLIKGYIIVELRIRLKFFLILIDGSIMVVGYLFGYLMFLLSSQWEYIYFFSSLISLIYVLNKTQIISEPLTISKNFKNLSSKTILLLFSVMLNSITVYLDKILLLPLLGGTAVTIYYISSIMGKSFALILNPISNVILSYISKWDTIKKNTFIYMLGTLCVIGFISYFLVVYLSEIILMIIYPEYFKEAMKYVPITVLTSIILSIIGVLNPILLKFKETGWQVLINFIYLFIYITLSLYLLNSFGLLGFCYGLLFAAIFKLIITILAYYSERILFLFSFLYSSK